MARTSPRQALFIGYALQNDPCTRTGQLDPRGKKIDVASPRKKSGAFGLPQAVSCGRLKARKETP